mmetsp:Transcript_23400/g.68890  ORF Transcript_23400/g.68890 Transcript_23400/m.68890 type:complete len:233 (+) Transcript_23400:486-1184(+)
MRPRGHGRGEHRRRGRRFDRGVARGAAGRLASKRRLPRALHVRWVASGHEGGDEPARDGHRLLVQAPDDEFAARASARPAPGRGPHGGVGFKSRTHHAVAARDGVREACGRALGEEHGGLPRRFGAHDCAVVEVDAWAEGVGELDRVHHAAALQLLEAREPGIPFAAKGAVHPEGQEGVHGAVQGALRHISARSRREPPPQEAQVRQLEDGFVAVALAAKVVKEAAGKGQLR